MTMTILFGGSRSGRNVHTTPLSPVEKRPSLERADQPQAGFAAREKYRRVKPKTEICSARHGDGCILALDKLSA
jgi:hypothetical protein